METDTKKANTTFIFSTDLHESFTVSEIISTVTVRQAISYGKSDSMLEAGYYLLLILNKK